MRAPASVFSLLVLASLSLVLPACTERSEPPVVRDRPDASGSGDVDAGSVPRDDASIVRPDTGVPPVTDCTERSRWIYLVDNGNALLRYEPDSGTLTPIGTLSCAAGETPFSMAVDRRANAFVLHSDRRVYQVSTEDASCTATSMVPNQMGFELFGMGFASRGEGSDLEDLFVAGGPEAGIGGGSSTLGRFQLPEWTVTSIGALAGSPELTGTGTGELWGFFPDASPMAVRQLNKDTGATLREIDVGEIDSSGLGIASAWAFAYWGGRFYVFYEGALDASTGIYRVTPDTGAVEPVRTNIGYRIVGAGVSTCAPTILI